ncbi:hypothetical protein ABPG75_010675 [Micractinium tetrahymenae]
MDARRAAARLRACVRDLSDWFEVANSSARRARLHSRTDTANELPTLLGVLDAGRIGEHIDLLLTLTDGLSVVAAAAAISTKQDQDAFSFASGWTALLAGSLVACHSLLRASRHFESAQQRQRLAACLPAVLEGGVLVCQRLLRLRQQEPAAFADQGGSTAFHRNLDESARLLLEVLTACLEVVGGGSGEQGAPETLADLLQRALPPERVLGCLRGALDVVEWAARVAGPASATSIGALFHALSMLADSEAHTGLPAALCGDAPLLARLARATADTHAALVAAPNWQDDGWRLRHNSFHPWPGRWCFLPFTAGQEPALLPLLVAAGSMLKGEVAILASFPAQPPAGAEPWQAEQLARCWLHGINLIARYLHLTLGPPRAAASQASPGRLRQLLQLAASSAQQVARFGWAAAAAVADSPPGEQAATVFALAESGPYPLGEVLRFWTTACAKLCARCRAAGPAGSSAQQQQQAAAAAAMLLGAQLELLNMLPSLVAAVESDAQQVPGSSSLPAAAGNQDGGSAATGASGDGSSSSASGSASRDARSPPDLEFQCLQLVYAAAETASLLAFR